MSCKENSPKICSICPRPAFLRCIDCDTIYCSSICQVSDWNSHQWQPCHTNKRNNVNSFYATDKTNVHTQRGKFIKEPKSSVQDRLKMASEKAPLNKILIEDKKSIDHSETVKLINSSSSSENIADNKAFPETLQAYEQKFLTTRPLLASANGYCRVIIKNIEKEANGNSFYYLVQVSILDDLNNYKIALNNTYDDSNIECCETKNFKKNLPNLYAVKFDNFWTRCRIAFIEKNGTFQAIDVDSGTKKSIDLKQDCIKPAIQREFETASFCTKTMLTNIDGDCDLEKDDIIEVKMIEILENGITVAEANIYSDTSDNESIEGTTINDQKNIEGEKFKADVQNKRYTIKDIKLKVLKPGKVNLLYLDASKLTDGKICICEALPEHSEFLEKLEKDIATFIQENPKAGNYKPIQFELVLAKFIDERYYRAMCKKIEPDENGCCVIFLEYGNELYVKFEDIIKLPEKLLRECISRSINIKLASGRSLTDIDINGTVMKLEEIEKFEAYIHNDSKCATICDSIVCLKN